MKVSATTPSAGQALNSVLHRCYPHLWQVGNQYLLYKSDGEELSSGRHNHDSPVWVYDQASLAMV